MLFRSGEDLHGRLRRQGRLPVPQALRICRQVAAALHAAHKDVALETLPNEDHWLSRSETRLQMLRASVDFLRTHNPPE